MPNVFIKEATIVITPSNKAVHAKIGEIFEVTQESADALLSSNRGVITLDEPYRIPDEDPKTVAKK